MFETWLSSIFVWYSGSWGGFHDGPVRRVVHLVGDGRLHGRQFVTGAVWWNLGGGHVTGRSYSGFTNSCFRSGPYCGISAGCDFNNRPWVGTVGGNPAVVRMFGSVPRAAVLAVAVRELVGGHGWQIVASPGSSVWLLSTRGTRSGASGYDSSISWFTVCRTFRRFTNNLSPMI